MASLTRRRVLVFGALVMLLAGVLVAGRLAAPARDGEGLGLPHAAGELREASNEALEAAANGELGDRAPLPGTQGKAGDESAEAMNIREQFLEARGIVPPGGYSQAFAQLSSLSTVGGAWDEITNVPYDADDPNYRDWFSNSGGGSGLVTGRITALAADGSGHVYAGGADGGVWRSSTGGGHWTPIADGLPTLSSGDLQLASDGSLWYATGEANTGGTSYVGSGVYRLADPVNGTFSASDRVGGTELESTTINALRFDGHGRVWAATLRGIWYHDATTRSGAWTLAYAPNPQYLPAELQAYSTTQTIGGSTTANAAYKNIVNDIAIDPRNADHLIAGIGWRSGDTYNGFYETTDRGAHWTKVNLTGGLDKVDIGNISFAWAGDGSKLYVINQSPKLLNSGAAIQMTYLDGVYVSAKGTLSGPWTKIASADKLAASGSALSKNFGIGYRPGIQAWYNQFLIVDPADPNHLYLGLEEVYETKDGGQHWNTVGPYWNFYFGCWSPDVLYPPDGQQGCPQTTHSDQHSVAIGSSGGTSYVYVGNDGGIYRRPLDGQVNRDGHATDWQSLNDGTIDALQYYAVDVGKANSANPKTPAGSGDVIVSGGLQDNGGSLYRIGSANGKMSSNFGGDGGDVLVDPNDGCRILQEYVVLDLEVTETCANPGHTVTSAADATTYEVAPPDVNARFIAPFVADAQNVDRWLAGGNSIWFQDKGFAIRSGSEWQKVYTFGPASRVATAMAYDGEWAVAGWCGGCNNAGFARGVAVGHYVNGAWTWTDQTAALDASNVPSRYIGGAAIDAAGNLYLAMNGFNRRFTEGPGAGLGHIFKSTDHGATWTLLDGSGANAFPDVPANSIKVLSNGAIVVGTDLGVVYRTADGSAWKRLGTGLPVTVSIDVELGPSGDAHLYVATHGRGLWRISTAGL